MKHQKNKIIAACLASLLGAAFLFPAAGCAKKSRKEDVYVDGKLQINLFSINIDCISMPTTESKKLIAALEDKFQIKFRATTATESNWSQVLNTQIALKNAPDFFFHLRKDPSYSNWLDWKMLTDYTPYLDAYPNIKAVFDAFDPNLKVLLGDGYYAYPIMLDGDLSVKETINHAMFYRRDWYTYLSDENGKRYYTFPQDYSGYNGLHASAAGKTVKDPESPDFDYLDFYDLAYAFTYGDPDGNGKDDTKGYGLNKDAAEYWWYPILSMFGVFSGNWEWTGESWEPQVYSDAMKEAVMFVADMYDKGMIPEGYSTSITKEDEKNNFVNGRYGMICFNAGSNGLGVYKLLDTDANKNAYKKYTNSEKATIEDIVRGMPAVTGKTGHKYVKGDYNNYGYMSIDNNCSQAKKKKILSLMDWLLSDEGKVLMDYGIEGDHWQWNADKTERENLLPFDNTGYRKGLWSDDIAPAGMRLKSLVSWEQKIFPDSQYYEERFRLDTAWNDKDRTEFLMNPLHFISPGPSFGMKIKDLETLVSDTYLKIVGDSLKNNPSGRENLWNQFVAKYKQEGKDYIRAMNAAAEAAKINH